MTTISDLVTCPGCGAQVQALPGDFGPAHRYVGATTGCWQVYLGLSGVLLEEPDFGTLHGLCTHTYMASHPGVPERQAIQSVAAHLIGLYWALERGLPLDQVARAMAKAHGDHFVWLEPPPSFGALTVVEIAAAGDAQTRAGLIRQWAQTVWNAWGAHHAQVQKWAGGS